MRPRRFIVVALTVCLLLGLAVTLAAGSWLAKPVNRPIGPPPPDLGAEVLAIPSASGSTLAGWFLPGRPGSGAILLLHGVRADRRILVPRARLLHQEGYSVLLVDFQAHGASPGTHVTFGHLEALDVAAAAQYLAHRLPSEPLGVIAISMGGAALTLAPRPLPFRAIVLESVYPDIHSAVQGRLTARLGPVGRLLTPLLLLQLRPRLGIDPDSLRPVDHVADLEVPALVMSGAQDPHPTPAEALTVFERLPGPKEWWLVPGAEHRDLMAQDPPTYAGKVLRFFGEHLRGTS